MSKSVGKSVTRVDAYEKATGRAKYVADLCDQSALVARILHATIAHGYVKSIDTTEAEAVPGVVKVLTCFNVPDYRFPTAGHPWSTDPAHQDVADRLLLNHHVRYYGDDIAAVIAENEIAAAQAVRGLKVEYEQLPAVTNAVEGMKPDAPLIHPDLHTYKVAPIFHPVPHTNISHHYKLRKGDVDKAFEACDVVTENTYYIPHVQHVPLEPHCAVAQYDLDGKVTVWGSIQSPYAVRQALSAAFDIPLNKLRVISPYVGGGFGAKAGTTLEGIIIPLARRNRGRPVKLNYSREDEFENSYVRQGLHCRIKTGINRDGKIQAVKNEFVWDGGAYTEYGVNITKAGGWASAGPYDIPNVWTDSYCVYTNHPVGGPYRGFGMCEIHFAIEQNIDEVALKIGMDPAQVRRINGLRPGGVTGTAPPTAQATRSSWPARI